MAISNFGRHVSLFSSTFHLLTKLVNIYNEKYFLKCLLILVNVDSNNYYQKLGNTSIGTNSYY